MFVKHLLYTWNCFSKRRHLKWDPGKGVREFPAKGSGGGMTTQFCQMLFLWLLRWLYCFMLLPHKLSGTCICLLAIVFLLRVYLTVPGAIPGTGQAPMMGRRQLPNDAHAPILRNRRRASQAKEFTQTLEAAKIQEWISPRASRREAATGLTLDFILVRPCWISEQQNGKIVNLGYFKPPGLW